MMIPHSRHMPEQEREDIIRDITRNGIGGTRLYLAGEPLSVFPDAFNSFVLWGCPTNDPTKQAAYSLLKEMGMDVTIVNVENHSRVMKAFKAVSTYSTFRYAFLDQITPRGNTTF